MKTCAHCGQPATQPQPSTRSESIPYRQQGWVGDQFIPYGKKWKGVRDIRITLCGLCYAMECLEIESLGEKDVNELQRELLQLAQKEVTARTGEKRAATKTLKDSPRVSRNPNGHKSPENTVLAESAACGDCQAYLEIKTYKLWREAGYQVQKREEVGPGFRVGKATLFCKHQVKEVA